MIKLVEFNLLDLHHICRNLPDDERVLWEDLTGDEFNVDEIAATMFGLNGMHWVFATENDIPVAAGGLIRQRPGVFRTWFFATQVAWDHHGKELTEAVRDLIQRVLDRQLAHRIETVTLASRSRARSWYKRIGLTEEATLRGYTVTGADAVMCVVTRSVEKT